MTGIHRGQIRPHRSGLKREPGRFQGPEAERKNTKGRGYLPTIEESTKMAQQARDIALSARNRAAEDAYEAALAPARLPLGHPDRVPYPDAARAALKTYDEVVARWGR